MVVVMMMFLTFHKTVWQGHIPFSCIIAVSVKANPESLTAHSPLHSSGSSLGVTTNFFLPNFNHSDPLVTVLLQEKR